MEIKKIGIIGAGSMGHGIAQVMAQSGYDVALIDIREDILNAAMERIEASLSKLVEKGKISPEQKEKTKKRITVSVEIAGVKDCQVIVEAVAENREMKHDIFRVLDETCGEDAVLATNTSSIPISDIARATKRPDSVIGMHFFNPPQIMSLVEVVKGERTSDLVVEQVKRLCEKIGKTPIVVKDSPGFVLNRLLIPMINDACLLLMNDVAGRKDIDQIMRLGANHPMGPLELADLIGLDVCLNILESIHKATGNANFKPCPLLKDMVAKGQLGRKTKKGFYDY